MRMPNGTRARIAALDRKEQLRWRRWAVEGRTAAWDSTQVDMAFELLGLLAEWDESAGGTRMRLASQLHEYRDALGLLDSTNFKAAGDPPAVTA